MHGLRSDGLQRRVPQENPPGLRLLLRTLDESRGTEFILSLRPRGVNGCHFVTVNPRVHVRAHVTAGFLSPPPPVTDGRHRQVDSRRRAVFFPTTTVISGVNWAAVVQRDDKELLGSCQKVAWQRRRSASSQQIPADRLVSDADFEMKIAHLLVRRPRVQTSSAECHI